MMRFVPIVLALSGCLSYDVARPEPVDGATVDGSFADASTTDAFAHDGSMDASSSDGPDASADASTGVTLAPCEIKSLDGTAFSCLGLGSTSMFSSGEATFALTETSGPAVIVVVAWQASGSACSINDSQGDLFMGQAAPHAVGTTFDYAIGAMQRSSIPSGQQVFVACEGAPTAGATVLEIGGGKTVTQATDMKLNRGDMPPTLALDGRPAVVVYAATFAFNGETTVADPWTPGNGFVLVDSSVGNVLFAQAYSGASSVSFPSLGLATTDMTAYPLYVSPFIIE